MACATLKRNLDWESMAQLPAKRRRCSPFAASSSTSPGFRVSENRSAFGEAVTAPAKLTPERMAQEICDEIKRLQRRRQLRVATGAASCSSSSGSEGDASPPHRSTHSGHAARAPQRALFTFKQVCVLHTSLQRRRQLRVAAGAASCSSSSGSEGDASPPHRSTHSGHAARAPQRALFTFKQVRMICERMLREQEAALRTEYEAALSTKLAEQYEAFVRFNLDQVQRRPPPSTCMQLGMDADHMHQDLVPSYLS